MKIKAIKSYINVNMYLFILMLQKIKLIKLISPTTKGQYDCKHRQERGYEIYIYLIIIKNCIANNKYNNNKPPTTKKISS